MQVVVLKELRPNPYRDFVIDPIDPENEQELIKSIKEDGFWSGVVARRINNSHYELACGHTRVRAAMKAGYKTAEIFVGNFDEAAMVRIMARENALQRGDLTAAVAGSVAAALRIISKGLLSGHISRILGMSQKAVETARGNLTSAKGIGEELILELLKNVPKIKAWTVREQLANLKASGDYARIIREVTDEIKKEEAEQLKALARAEKEAARAKAEAERAEEEHKKAREQKKKAKAEAEKKAAEVELQRTQLEAERSERYKDEVERELKQFDALRETRDATDKAAAAVDKNEPTFDFTGVSKYLKTDAQIKAFRQLVTGETVSVPLAEQAALAKRLVEAAKAANDGEITSGFIRANLQALMSDAKRAATKLSKEEEAALRAKDAQVKFKYLQDEFCRGVYSINKHGQDILRLLNEHRGVDFQISPKFREHVRYAQDTINKLANKLITTR